MDIGIVQSRTCRTGFLGTAAQRDDARAGDHVVRLASAHNLHFGRSDFRLIA